jgi:dTMP kinase
MEANNRGLFIVLEGPDGAGHGTQAELLKNRMISIGREVILTREPGGTPVGEAIRNIFIRKDLAPTPLTEVFLCAAFRAQHVEEKIHPALGGGIDVVSERFFYSTLAYQHFARGQNRDLIETTTKMAIGNLLPDLVIIIDVPSEVGLRRKYAAAEKGGGPELDRFEVEAFDFHRKVRAGYLDLAKQYSFPVIDGCQGIQDVSDQVFGQVMLKIQQQTKPSVL